MSRLIEHMHPTLQPLVREFIERCEAELPDGVDVLITCTWRSEAEQARLYAQGRTAPGPIVTRAKPGQSKHNHMLNGKPASLAFDFVPVKDGKCVWGTYSSFDKGLWESCGAIGESLGFTWFGREGSQFKESPHLQRVV